MRRLSLLAGAVLALSLASTAVAAAPTVKPATWHGTPVAAAHHWTATLTQTSPVPTAGAATLHGRARLFLAPAGKAGWVEVQTWGVPRGATLQVAVADTTASPGVSILTGSRIVKAHSGRSAFLIRLNATSAGLLKTSALAKDTLTITVTATVTTTSGTTITVATGTFKATGH